MDFGGQRRTETEDSGQTKNPGKLAVFQGFPPSDTGLSKVEAPGIEPGSRGSSAAASTCVACRCWPAATLRLRRLRSPFRSPASRVPAELIGCEV